MKPKGTAEEQKAAIEAKKEEKLQAEKALEEAKAKAVEDAKAAEKAADKKIEVDAAKAQADLMKAKRESVFGPSKVEADDNVTKVSAPKALSDKEMKKDKEE